jgi:hypothetical protein
LTNHGIEHITFFSVIDESLEEFEATEKYLKELKELYSNRAITSYELYKGDVVVANVKEILTQKQSQFLVVQKGSRQFFDQIFRSFLINELAYEGEIPLIVIP